MCHVKLRILPSQPAPPGHITCTMMSICPQVSSPAGGWTKVLLMSHPAQITLLWFYYSFLGTGLSICLCWICAFAQWHTALEHAGWFLPPSLVLKANLLGANSTRPSVKMKLTGPRIDPWTLFLQHPEFHGLYPINQCPLIMTTQSVFYPSSCLPI